MAQAKAILAAAASSIQDVFTPSNNWIVWCLILF